MKLLSSWTLYNYNLGVIVVLELEDKRFPLRKTSKNLNYKTHHNFFKEKRT